MLKKTEYQIGFLLYFFGIFLFGIDTGFKFGEYTVYAIFVIGFSITIYQIIRDKFFAKK